MQIASLLSEPCYAFRVGHRSMSSVRCPADRSLHPTRHRIDRHKRYGVDTEKQKKKNNKGFPPRSRSFARTIGLQNASQEPHNPCAIIRIIMPFRYVCK